MNRVEIIKSRTNADGKVFNLIYDKVKGHSAIRSTVDLLKELGLVSGNKNGYYFTTDPDKNKFTLANMEEDFNSNPILYKVMTDTAKPILEEDLGTPPLEGTRGDSSMMSGFYD